MAWTTEKDKATAPELLAAPKNIAHLALIDNVPELLRWKKASTGNGLLHCAVLYKSKPTIAALLGKGASQEPNHAGVTPKEMAEQESVAWPSTFGQSKKAAGTTPAATPRPRGDKPVSTGSGSSQMNLFE